MLFAFEGDSPPPVYQLKWGTFGFYWSSFQMFGSGKVLSSPPDYDEIGTILLCGSGQYDYTDRIDEIIEPGGVRMIVADYSPGWDAYLCYPDTLAGHKSYLVYKRHKTRIEMGWAAIRLHKIFYQWRKEVDSELGVNHDIHQG